MGSSLGAPAHWGRRFVVAGLVAVVGCAFAALTLRAGPAGGHSRAVAGRALRDLTDLPAAARGPIATALAAEDPAFAVRGLRAANPYQGFQERFSASGVTLRSGAARLRLTLSGYGRVASMTRARPATPRAVANRVSYARGGLREWYANGPLGLEQGFDVLRAPQGPGPLTLALHTAGNLAASDRGAAITLAGAGQTLSYGALRATDATGRHLPAALGFHGHTIVVRVQDRAARYPVHIDPLVQKAILTNNAGRANDEAGASVAVSGDTIAVGVPAHTVGTVRNQGAVYVFAMPVGGWKNITKPTAILTTADGAKGDLLGGAVAFSGDTIVAGADSHKVGTATGAGTVYLFTKPSSGGWVTTAQPDAELIAFDPAQGDGFGFRVAASPDTIVVGVPFHTLGGNTGQGVAYVFTKPATGWASTSASAQLNADDGATSDVFGNAVDVASDGTVVVGANGHDVGANADQGEVYLWDKPPGGWVGGLTPSARFLAPDGIAGDAFGDSVAISTDTLAVGAPDRSFGNSFDHGLAYVYTKPAGGWSSTSTAAELSTADGLEQAFGSHVAVDGATVLVSAPYRTETVQNQGAILEFDRPAGGWATTSAPSADLTASDPANDTFGYALAASGGVAVVGAPFRALGARTSVGAVYVFGATAQVVPPPTASITAPGKGASYLQGQKVAAAYSCADAGGPGLVSCTGTVPNGSPVSTSTLGSHTFTVTAVDTTGKKATASVTYTVVAAPPPVLPTVSIATPANGASYLQGQKVAAAYNCADAGGPGLVSCTGTVPNGSPVSTSTLGPHGFTVTATDVLGATRAATTSYTVLKPATAGTAPTLSHVHQSHRRWREHRGSGKTPVGTTFSFRLSQDARVSLTFTRHLAGHRVGRRCAAGAPKRGERACTGKKGAGTLRLRAHSGANEVRFTGRTLGPGTYDVAIRAVNAAGKRSRSSKLTFTIVARVAEVGKR
jgi:hypothetical protein